MNCDVLAQIALGLGNEYFSVFIGLGTDTE